MLCCRDEIPPLSGDTYLKAQGREHFEQQFRLRLHLVILHAAQLLFVIVGLWFVFKSAERPMIGATILLAGPDGVNRTIRIRLAAGLRQDSTHLALAPEDRRAAVMALATIAGSDNRRRHFPSPEAGAAELPRVGLPQRLF
jgi:hypothetical protein